MFFGNIVFELREGDVALFYLELGDAYFVVEYLDIALKRRALRLQSTQGTLIVTDIFFYLIELRLERRSLLHAGRSPHFMRHEHRRRAEEKCNKKTDANEAHNLSV